MNIPLIRRFGLPLVLMAAAAVLLAGCNDSSPTEPKVAAASTPTPTTIPTPSPTPLPPGGNIAGTWTGTFNTSICGGFTEQASFEQNGSTVAGSFKGTGATCNWDLAFSGTLQGSTLAGSVTDYDILLGGAHGTLSGSSLEITIDNGGSFVIGQLHLHR